MAVKAERMVRYLVRCVSCDRAFWLEQRDAVLPEHSRWERRPHGHHETGHRCDGSERPGYWIGEGEGPLTD